MSSTAAPISHDNPLNLTAALLTIVNGAFGLVCNSLIVFIFIQSPAERTSFNLICFVRGLGNCLILGWAFIGTFMPMTLLGDSLFPPMYQSIVITSVTSTYTGLQYCGVLIAANRFFAMYFPLIYSTVFTVKFTLLQIVVLFGYRFYKIVYECNFNFSHNCFSVYSSEALSWIPIQDPVCRLAPSSIIDGTAILLGFLIIMNLATFIKIYFFYKATEHDEKEVKKRVRRNKILFLQTVVQDVTYLIDMLFTYKLSSLIDARYWTFISGSFVWQSVHSFDGLIMIMFNERLTFLKTSFFPSSSNPSVVQHIVHSANTVSAFRGVTRVD